MRAYMYISPISRRVHPFYNLPCITHIFIYTQRVQYVSPYISRICIPLYFPSDVPYICTSLIISCYISPYFFLGHMLHISLMYSFIHMHPCWLSVGPFYLCKATSSHRNIRRPLAMVETRGAHLSSCIERTSLGEPASRFGRFCTGCGCRGHRLSAYMSLYKYPIHIPLCISYTCIYIYIYLYILTCPFKSL